MLFCAGGLRKIIGRKHRACKDLLKVDVHLWSKSIVLSSTHNKSSSSSSNVQVSGRISSSREDFLPAVLSCDTLARIHHLKARNAEIPNLRANLLKTPFQRGVPASFRRSGRFRGIRPCPLGCQRCIAPCPAAPAQFPPGGHEALGRVQEISCAQADSFSTVRFSGDRQARAGDGQLPNSDVTSGENSTP